MRNTRALTGAGLTLALIGGGLGLSGTLTNADATAGTATVRSFDNVDVPSEIAAAAGTSRADLMDKGFNQGYTLAEIAQQNGIGRAALVQRLNARADTYLLPRDRAKARAVILANLDRHWTTNRPTPQAKAAPATPATPATPAATSAAPATPAEPAAPAAPTQQPSAPDAGPTQAPTTARSAPSPTQPTQDSAPESPASAPAE